MPNRVVVFGTAIGQLDQADQADGLKVTTGKGAGEQRPVSRPPVSRLPKIDPNEVVSSGKSVVGYHSSLFRDFHLSAVSTYSFYTDDEGVEPTADVSGTLQSLPRYVTLRWNTAPLISATKTVPSKTVRPFITSKVVRHRPAASLEVAAGALANGYISPGVISALIAKPPPPTTKLPTEIDEDSFLLSPSMAGRAAADVVGDRSSEFSSVARTTSTARASVVNFIDPSIAGAFAGTRLDVATDPLHLTVVGSLAKVIAALEVISEFNQDVPIQNPPPDFTGHSDSPAISYIGYIIERYDMLPNGSMELGRLIMVDDITRDEFIDQRVSYGGIYSYRIRAIVQWSRSNDVDFGGTSTIDRISEFSALVAPPLASFYGADWSDWARTQVLDTVPPEPPDELTARPVSNRGEIHVSWRVGHNPQPDLTNFKLLRAVCIGGKISDWSEVGTFVIANGLYIDRDVRPYEDGSASYVYAMYATSFHGVDSPLSDQVEVRLSPFTSNEEYPVIQLAATGADRAAHAVGRQLSGSTEVKANRRLTFYCRSTSSGHPLRDSTYLVEVRSLSTGERALVALDVDATDIGVIDA
jgi:hypothetical protein